MDVKDLESTDKVEQKLIKTKKKIQKTRKNIKLAEKEIAEFEEIRRLLNTSIENDSIVKNRAPLLDSLDQLVECSTIPFVTPWLTIFKGESMFNLFDQETICLIDFIEESEDLIFFEGNESRLSEETFRLLISSHFIEAFMPENEKYPKISLYVLYLMSVHDDPQFVDACYDFLKFRSFRIRPEDILTIFRNLGVDEWKDNLWNFREERLLRKFNRRNGNIDKISRSEFPYYNLEWIGRTLIDNVSNDLFEFTEELKTLISLLGRIILDRTIRFGYLTSIYCTLLTILCKKATERGGFDVNEISDLLDFHNENPILRSEVCRALIRSIHPELHDIHIIKTISGLLKCVDIVHRFPIRVDGIKVVLQKCKTKEELVPLEFYSIFQLLNSSLPHLTATPEDSAEINVVLSQLDNTISQIEDSVDRIRLKREVAKMRNLIANNTLDRFVLNE